MKRLGRSLLRIAQARAQEQGVMARAEVRSGPVWQVIEEYLRGVNASALVIGAPRVETASQAFGPADVHRFAEAVRQATGVEVIVVA
jgi:RNase H-fold protein (predicted Holliday junction resolvase)